MLATVGVVPYIKQLMTQEYESPEQQRGYDLINRGHMLTKFRHDTSPLLGAYIAVSDENHATTAIHAGEIITDWLDGRYARAGSEILGIDTSERGKIDDPKADKRLVGSVILGLTARYARRGDRAGATICAANALVDYWRNKRMDESRALAISVGISPGATKINKAKMALQSSGELILTSKAAKKPLVRNIGLAAMSIGTGIGIIGRHQFHKSVLDRQQLNAAACPDTIEPRSVLDDTTQESSLVTPEENQD